MRVEAFEKVEKKSLTVAGVEAELVDKFKALTDKTGAPAAFYINQMLTDFFRSVEKQAKPKAGKSQKAAAA